MVDKQVPTLVKVISVFYYISAITFVILFIIGALIIRSIANQIPALGAFGTGAIIFGGIMALGFGILAFFIGRGLWKGRNWARIVAIIIACIVVIGSILNIIYWSMITGVVYNLVNIIISGFIGSYLLFSKDVKKAFA